jgi:hypothetical protein
LACGRFDRRSRIACGGGCGAAAVPRGGRGAEEGVRDAALLDGVCAGFEEGFEGGEGRGGGGEGGEAFLELGGLDELVEDSLDAVAGEPVEELGEEEVGFVGDLGEGELGEEGVEEGVFELRREGIRDSAIGIRRGTQIPRGRRITGQRGRHRLRILPRPAGQEEICGAAVEREVQGFDAGGGEVLCDHAQRYGVCLGGQVGIRVGHKSGTLSWSKSQMGSVRASREVAAGRDQGVRC